MQTLGLTLVLLLTMPVDEMRARVAARLARLDRLVVTVAVSNANQPADSNPLDMSTWAPAGAHWTARLTIRRPEVLYESLTLDPDQSRRPTLASTAGARFVARNAAPNARTGRESYRVVPHTTRGDDFVWCPVLQMFDLEWMDETQPHVNTLTLLSDERVEALDDIGGLHRYHLGRRDDATGWQSDYFLDLDDNGLPWHVSKTLTPPADRSATPFTWEQHVLRVADVNGAALPVEVITTIWNPGVRADKRGVWHFEVAQIETRRELTPESVRIEPPLRNSQITTYNADGSLDIVAYDPDGNLARSDHTFGHEPYDPAMLVSKASLKPRRWIPPVAAGIGACVMLTLHFASRRRRIKPGKAPPAAFPAPATPHRS